MYSARKHCNCNWHPSQGSITCGIWWQISVCNCDLWGLFLTPQDGQKSTTGGVEDLTGGLNPPTLPQAIPTLYVHYTYLLIYLVAANAVVVLLLHDTNGRLTFRLVSSRPAVTDYTDLPHRIVCRRRIQFPSGLHLPMIMAVDGLATSKLKAPVAGGI